MRIGAKTIETRSWPTEYRGDVLIHAGLNTTALDLILEPPFTYYKDAFRQLHLGHALCVVRLTDCVPTEEVLPQIKHLPEYLDNWHESAFGDYSPGRYAWITDNLRVLETPVKMRGAQGLFESPFKLEELRFNHGVN